MLTGPAPQDIVLLYLLFREDKAPDGKERFNIPTLCCKLLVSVAYLPNWDSNEDGKMKRTKPEPRKLPSQHILETTLAIIKPDGMLYRLEILRMLLNAGFQIIQQKIIMLSPDQAADFYRDQTNSDTFNLMVLSLSEGPIEVMCLAKDNCIEDWKRMMESKITIESNISYSDTIQEKLGTVVHGSESERSAKFEIRYFFPNVILEPLHQDDAYKLCSSSILMKTLFDGLYKVTVERPDNPLNWLSAWLLHNNPFKPIITEVCDQHQANVEECEKTPTEQWKPATITSSSSKTSCTLSTLSSRHLGEVFRDASGNIDDRHCSPEYVLKTNDITFCPVCHKITKYQLTEPCVGCTGSLSSDICSSTAASNAEY